jgi:hypothetical protein
VIFAVCSACDRSRLRGTHRAPGCRAAQRTRRSSGAQRRA